MLEIIEMGLLGAFGVNFLSKCFYAFKDIQNLQKRVDACLQQNSQMQKQLQNILHLVTLIQQEQFNATHNDLSRNSLRFDSDGGVHSP